MANIHEPKASPEDVPIEVIPLENTETMAASGGGDRPAELLPLGSEPTSDATGEEMQLPTPDAQAVPVLPLTPPTFVVTHLEEPRVENKRLVAMFVKDDDLRDLWERASRVKSDIINSVNDVPTAVELLNMIEVARNQMLAGRQYYEQSERIVNEIEYRIALNKRVIQSANSLGVWLFIYETVWAIALLVFLFVVLGPAAFSSAAIPGSNWASPDVVFLLGSMTWGALGGVIGAWLSLVRHITKDHDFDSQHLLWYINSPVMGIGVGAVIFLILRAGLLSITGPSDSISSPLVIYLLAWLSGFQQNVFIDLIRRLLQVFKIDGSEEENVPTAVKQQTLETQLTDVSPNGRS